MKDGGHLQDETSLKNERGGALVAALILVVVSGVMGATILFATSTEIQISGNYRRTIKSFYAAESGLAESQRRLSGLPTTNPWFAGDPSPIPQTNWSGYLLSNSEWKPQDDPAFSTMFANYVPLNGNFTNTAILPNSVQSNLSYWTKIRHKTEFDAEQSGHSVASPHYVDGDETTKTHSKTNRGNLVLFGYPLNLLDVPVQFSSSIPAMYSPVEVILSHGQVEGAISIIQAEMVHQPGPPILAPVYAENRAEFAGGNVSITGVDACGFLPNGRPPIALGPIATIFGTAELNGNPSSPTVRSSPLGIGQQIGNLQSGAHGISGDLNGVILGTPTAPTFQYAEPTSGFLSLNNVRGYGVLLINGSLRIYPPFLWEGLIIVSGGIIIEAGLSPAQIRGALYADQILVLNNDVTIALDTCPIAVSLPLLPLKFLNWQQML